jgi:hypothetical protein
MSGREWNPELSLLIRGEGCDLRDFPGLPIRTRMILTKETPADAGREPV